MARLRCPTCHEPFDSEQSRAMPFCSERCRLLDLGRWLNEEVGLPSGEPDDEPEGFDPPSRPRPLPPRPDSRRRLGRDTLRSDPRDDPFDDSE